MPNAWFRYVVAWVLTYSIYWGGGGICTSAFYFWDCMIYVSRSCICYNCCCFTIRLFDGVRSIILGLCCTTLGLGVHIILLLLGCYWCMYVRWFGSLVGIYTGYPWGYCTGGLYGSYLLVGYCLIVLLRQFRFGLVLLPTQCYRLWCCVGLIVGCGRYTFFGRDPKNLFNFYMTWPALCSKSMFSHILASNFQVKFIMSPRSIILMGDLFA